MRTHGVPPAGVNPSVGRRGGRATRARPRLLPAGPDSPPPPPKPRSRRPVRGVWGLRGHGERDVRCLTHRRPGTTSRTSAHATLGYPRAQNHTTPSPSNPGAGAPTRTQDYEPNWDHQGAVPISTGIAAHARPHYCGLRSPPHTHAGAVCTHTNSWAGEATPHSWGWGHTRRRQPSFSFTRRTLSLLTAAPQPQPCKLQETKQPTPPR